jgi:ubiquinone/menaquinone biosynthesis C-methylase UbiE
MLQSAQLHSDSVFKDPENPEKLLHDIRFIIRQIEASPHYEERERSVTLLIGQNTFQLRPPSGHPNNWDAALKKFIATLSEISIILEQPSQSEAIHIFGFSVKTGKSSESRQVLLNLKKGMDDTLQPAEVIIYSSILTDALGQPRKEETINFELQTYQSHLSMMELGRLLRDMPGSKPATIRYRGSSFETAIPRKVNRPSRYLAEKLSRLDTFSIESELTIGGSLEAFGVKWHASRVYAGQPVEVTFKKQSNGSHKPIEARILSDNYLYPDGKRKALIILDCENTRDFKTELTLEEALSNLAFENNEQLDRDFARIIYNDKSYLIATTETSGSMSYQIAMSCLHEAETLVIEAPAKSAYAPQAVLGLKGSVTPRFTDQIIRVHWKKDAQGAFAVSSQELLHPYHLTEKKQPKVEYRISGKEVSTDLTAIEALLLFLEKDPENKGSQDWYIRTNDGSLHLRLGEEGRQSLEGRIVTNAIRNCEHFEITGPIGPYGKLAFFGLSCRFSDANRHKIGTASFAYGALIPNSLRVVTNESIPHPVDSMLDREKAVGPGFKGAEFIFRRAGSVYNVGSYTHLVEPKGRRDAEQRPLLPIDMLRLALGRASHPESWSKLAQTYSEFVSHLSTWFTTRLGLSFVMNSFPENFGVWGKNPVFLSLGSGPGTLFEAVEEATLNFKLNNYSIPTVVDIDSSLGMLELSKNPRRVLADAFNIPLKSGSVAVVEISTPYHLDSKTIGHYIEESARVLQKGGILWMKAEQRVFSESFIAELENCGFRLRAPSNAQLTLDRIALEALTPSLRAKVKASTKQTVFLFAEKISEPIHEIDNNNFSFEPFAHSQEVFLKIRKLALLSKKSNDEETISIGTEMIKALELSETITDPALIKPIVSYAQLYLAKLFLSSEVKFKLIDSLPELKASIVQLRETVQKGLGNLSDSEAILDVTVQFLHVAQRMLEIINAHVSLLIENE